MEKRCIKIAILDVETTGLNPKIDRIIQFACLTLDADCAPVKLFDSYINPGKDAANIFKNSSFKVHKISHEMLQNEPSFEEKAQQIFDTLRDVDIVVGHNIVFDWDMLRHEFARLDEISPLNEDDTDESWNAAKRAENLDLQKPGPWRNMFCNLKFHLLDTYRMAIGSYPNEPSYSLSSLSRRFNLRLRKCHTVSYKWRSQDDMEESELCVEQQNEKMPPHNAITDVLSTAKLFKDCLKTLNIKLAELTPSNFPEYFVSKPLVEEAERLMEMNPTDQQLKNLAEIAPYHMNVNHPCKGSRLKNMKARHIQLVIDHLSKGKSTSEKREALICRSFKYLASFNESGQAIINAEKTKEDMLHGLHFDSDNKNEINKAESPLKAKMKQIRLSEVTDHEDGAPNSRLCNKDGVIATKVLKMSSEEHENTKETEAAENKEISVTPDVVESSEDSEEVMTPCLSNVASELCKTPEKTHLIRDDGKSAENLVSPVFDRTSFSVEESLSESILDTEYSTNCFSEDCEKESQVFPMVDAIQKTPNKQEKEHVKNVRKMLLMSPDY